MGLREELILKNPENTCAKIINFIREKLHEFGKKGIVLGVSGGVDSALVASFAKEAAGREKVLSLFMPERDTDPMSRKYAYLVADNLKISIKEINLTRVMRGIGVYRLEPSPLFFPRSIQEQYVFSKFRQFQDDKETTFLKFQKGGEENKELMKAIAFLRIKHRLRMVMWYYEAELRNYLVLGCCNKTEKLTGYFIKYGDSAADIEPIAGLYKTQVRQLACFSGVPQEIIEKAPTPDLMPGMTDEFALQFSYEDIDLVLFGLERGLPSEEIVKEARVTLKDLDYIKTLVEISSHMRRMPSFPEL